MKRYRLHDLLRAAAATWLAAACASGGTAAATDTGADDTADAATLGDGGVDASAETAPVDAPAADADTDALQPADAAPDVGDDTAQPDSTTDTAVDAALDAQDAEPKPDIGPDAAADAAADAADTSKASGPFGCKNPQPILSKGIDTGVDVCQGGMLRRRAIVQCPSVLPEVGKMCTGASNGPVGECTTDLDCAAKAKGGHCENSLGPGDFCYCASSCVSDSECGAGQLCLCGEKYGTCVMAGCKSGADCVVGDCVSYTNNPGCGSTAMNCESLKDACGAKVDCKPAEECTWNGGKGNKYCSPPMCAIGRPYESAGGWQIAPIVDRADWQAVANSEEVLVATPDDATRTRLRDHFLQAAQMEHASVAAFAQLTLDLLAVGAPPELIRRTQGAGIDEVAHAQTCFGLAQYFGAPACGPGPLPLNLTRDQPSLASVAEAAAREGCVFETVAALEASITAAETANSHVQAALLAIADDEARHAELSWDIVRWAWQAGDAGVKAAIHAGFAAGVADLRFGDVGEALPPGLGAQAGSRLRAIREHALAQVVEPARRRLVGSPETH